MLQHISIKNYAIIDHLSIDFHSGFSVFTGETGAGKSILIGALGLLLGSRSDFSMIRSGTECLTVEGEFCIKDINLQNFLKTCQIDNPSIIIIRREVFHHGKTRIFINGHQSTLSKLETIGSRLADMHSQHDHQLLLNKKIHREVLDSFAALSTLQQSFSVEYKKTIELIDRKLCLENSVESLHKERTFYHMAYKEINNASLKEDEIEHLESELLQMSNKEQIVDSLHTAYNNIYNRDINATQLLEDAYKTLQLIAKFSDNYEELAQIINDAVTKTKECAHLLSNYTDQIDFDNNKMDKVIARLSFIKELKRKYQKNSITELNFFAKECETSLETVNNTVLNLQTVSQEYIDQITILRKSALILSKSRKDAAKKLSTQIEKELHFLGMESAKFEIAISCIKTDISFLTINEIPVLISEHGIDHVEFMISTNNGEQIKPLAKVASGGEISRIMLALKSILAQSDPSETGIFDEIDSGIGGLVANNIALKMKKISHLRQIFCITHLAQIASKADHHYTVKKEHHGTRTITNVVLLKTAEERIKEIARMLGGEGEHSESLAREMLAQMPSLTHN